MAKKRSIFYFPEELIFQILSWLPVLSLLRFRSVCKSWRSMISSPQFAENHLASSHKKEAYVLTFATDMLNEAGSIGDFDNAFYVDTRDVSFTLNLPPRFSGIKHFVSSCNGLVLLSNRGGDLIYLWNPLTKRIKKLSTPKIQARFGFNIGFCFNSISNDYTILRIVQSNVSYAGSVTSLLEAELYSTNANSWKEIQVPKTVKKILPWPYSNCVDSKAGVLYLNNHTELLSFDSHNEVFGVYPFPKSVHYRRKSGVLDFNGFVAMISESVYDQSVLSLWTLNDVCGTVSWVKKFTFEALHGIRWIDIHLGAGQFVVQFNTAGRHFFYDEKKKKARQFPLPPRLEDIMSVVKYTESLVSLEGFEQLD